MKTSEVCLRRTTPHADYWRVWIDRVITESPEGQQESELHPRLTVISSADRTRRREVYERIIGALQVRPGTTLHVRTEFGDSITAKRGLHGGSALFHTNNNLPIASDEGGLGIVGQLNSSHDMDGHLELFHVTTEQLFARNTTDKDLLAVASAPLDQLFELAARITKDEQELNAASDKRSTLHEQMNERASKEQSMNDKLQDLFDSRRSGNNFATAALGLVGLGLVAALFLNPRIGLAMCAVGLLAAAVGWFRQRSAGEDAEIASEALEIQLGRVDELFNTHDLSRSRSRAEENLADSRATWHSIAGYAEPSILLKDRPRIEELASHLRLIRNEQVEVPGDTSLLTGFASLLAELNRRFPAERVPLLVDDVFAIVEPQYHAVMRELLLRASHRRQVVLESADLVVTKWAAVEAVGGDALLITDHEIDVEPIIASAVGPEAGTTV